MLPCLNIYVNFGVLEGGLLGGPRRALHRGVDEADRGPEQEHDLPLRGSGPGHRGRHPAPLLRGPLGGPCHLPGLQGRSL